MASNAMLAEIAALAGDPARAGMLQALMDGRALTASELAQVAGIAPQTASGHLARMTAAGLLTVEKQGRHRYHRLATSGVAQMLESIMQVAAELRPAPRRVVVGPRDVALRKARTCYDHLAGRLGVAVLDAMTERHLVETRRGVALTEAGLQWLHGLGVDVEQLEASRRPLARACLDWTERRPHLAGAAGAALCARLLDTGWVERTSGRAVRVTDTGSRALRRLLGLTPDDLCSSTTVPAAR